MYELEGGTRENKPQKTVCIVSLRDRTPKVGPMALAKDMKSSTTKAIREWQMSLIADLATQPFIFHLELEGRFFERMLIHTLIWR